MFLRNLILMAVVWLGAVCVTAQLSPAQHASGRGTYDALPIEGFSQPFRSARVAAAVSGIVQERSVPEGSEVFAGECLLQLDARIHSELLEISRLAKDAQGELAAAQAELSARRTRLDRIEELAARTHASPIELLQAREQVELAEANLLVVKEKQLHREAEHQRLAAEAQQYCISAPFDGVVVEFLKEKGEYVGPADPDVCTIAQLDVLSVNFLVPRARRGEIELGGEATMMFVDDGRRVTGTVYYLSPFPDGETNTFLAKIRVDNSDRSLNAGSRCDLLGVQKNAKDHDPAQQLTTHHE